MSSTQPVSLTDLPDAAREDLLGGASVPVERDGVRVGTIVPDRAPGSKLLSLAGALHFQGRLDEAEIEAGLDRRRG